MAKQFYKDKPVIGLDIGQTGVKIMSINLKKWLVSGFGSLDLDPAKMQKSLEDDDEYLTENITTLLKDHVVGSLESDHTVVSLPAGKTFTRTFVAPKEARKKLKDAVELEVEQYIPVPLSTLYVDYEVIEETKDTITVLMCAVPKTLVDACTKAAEAAGLRVIMVEPSINAVARLLERTEEGHLPTVIVDIGPASTDIAILDGSIRVTGTLPIGGNTFTLDIAKKLKVPLENAHQLKVLSGLNPGNRQQKLVSSLSPSLERIVNETRKVIRYYDERIENHSKLEQVIIVGAGANVPGIGDYFTNTLVMPARVASPWQKLEFGKLQPPAKQFRSRYITVAGLSIIEPTEIWR